MKRVPLLKNKRVPLRRQDKTQGQLFPDPRSSRITLSGDDYVIPRAVADYIEDLWIYVHALGSRVRKAGHIVGPGGADRPEITNDD